MTDTQTTENPWKVPMCIKLRTNATSFRFDLAKTQEPTVIKGPARMGMSLLMRRNNAKMEEIHDGH